MAKPPRSTSELAGTFFGNLPYDMFVEILKHGKIDEALNLAKTNPLMRKRVKHVAADAITDALLTCTTQVSEEDVKIITSILDVFPELLFQKREVTDPCGRTFSSISAFQYAKWAKDADLLDLMFEYIKDKPDYVTEAEKQRNELATTGVEFTYTELAECPGYYPAIKEGVCVKGSHEFDNTQLQQAYQTYSTNYAALVSASNWAALDNCWIKTVGGAQRLLPACFAQAYCQDFHFNQTAEELDRLFRQPLKRTTQLYSATWFPLSSASGLGLEFGICCGWRVFGVWQDVLAGAGQPGALAASGLDSAAYDRLCQVRADRMKKFDHKLELASVVQAESAAAASRRPSRG